MFTLANAFPIRKLRPAHRSWLDLIHFTELPREVACEEIILSSSELEESLESRAVRASDLILILGVWTPISEAPQFAEVAARHARRERRFYTLKSALALLGFLALLGGLVAAQFVVFPCPYPHHH